MEIVIEKDVPLMPTLRRMKYPLQAMDVGDSFEIEDPKGTLIVSLRSSVSRLKPKLFVVRRVGEGKVRCWRTA